MKTVLAISALMLLQVMPASAESPPSKETSPIERMAIVMELHRAHASKCRTDWNVFSVDELAAMTAASAAMLQIAKFELDVLTNIGHNAKTSADEDQWPKTKCDALQRMYFGETTAE